MNDSYRKALAFRIRSASSNLNEIMYSWAEPAGFRPVLRAILKQPSTIVKKGTACCKESSVRVLSVLMDDV